MGHHFHDQQIGPIHHVPSTAAAEGANEIFEHMHMQLHGLLSGDARFS
jgi:hypothetical protein